MEGTPQALVDMGLPGLVIFALAGVVAYLYRRQDKRQEAVENELRGLRLRFDEYMEEDRKEMLGTIRDNTQACHELHTAIKELTR